MALAFVNAASDRAVVGSQAVYDDMTTFSVLLWVKPGGIAGGNFLLSKQSGAAGWRLGIDGAAGQMVLRRGRAISALQYITLDRPLVTGQDRCVIAIVDLANNVGHIWSGDVATAVAEHTYGTASGGSGSWTAGESDAAIDLVFGNNGPVQNHAFDGDISYGTVITRPVSEAEMNAWRLDPASLDADPSCIWSSELDNATTVTDESVQGNDAAVTGASLVASVDLSQVAARVLVGIDLSAHRFSGTDRSAHRYSGLDKSAPRFTGIDRSG